MVLPEVFLKAVALVRNQGIPLDELTTVNIDFLRMYRPQTNVVSRPVAGTGGTRHFARRPPRDPDPADRGRAVTAGCRLLELDSDSFEL